MKYEYHRPDKDCIFPHAELKQGEIGVLRCVAFLDGSDWLYGDRILDLPVDPEKALAIWGRDKMSIPPLLESCSDLELDVISTPLLDDQRFFPKEELVQIRELEKKLRTENPNYRKIDEPSRI